MPEEVGRTHDFIVTNKGADFYELMISTSEGLYFATIKTVMRGNNFNLEFDEEENYFKEESITAMLEIKPRVFAVAVAGSNFLQIIDRNKLAVVQKIPFINKEVYGIK